MTPAAGSGGQGDQAGDRATLRDSGWSACGVAVQCPPNATLRCTAEASEALKAEAWDVSTGERSLPLAIPEPARVADGRLGRSVPMAKGEAHQAARGGQPPGRVHMETGRWPCHHNLSYRSGSKVACGARRAPQEAGRKAIGLKSKLGLDNGHGERMQRQGMRTAGPAAWLRRTGTGEMKGVASSRKPTHPASAPRRAAHSKKHSLMGGL